MSIVGLRVGAFEITGEAQVPEAGRWFLARRASDARKSPSEALVKYIGPDAPPEARTALQKEQEALKALDGTHVPELIGLYEGLGALAVAQVEGAPISEIIERRRNGQLAMTPATLLDLGLEISEAIQHAHHKGRHHGHLSPDQIILGPDGRITVWGFGPGSRATPQPRWAAPERAKGEPVSGATDQWALGAILAALITGQAPWRGDDPEAEARRGDPAAAVGPVNAQWPAFGRLLRKLMDPRPGSRFPSIHPARQDLFALARKAGGASERRELGSRLWAEWQARASSPEFPRYDAVDEEPEPRGARPAPLPLDVDAAPRTASPDGDADLRAESDGAEAPALLAAHDPARAGQLHADLVEDDYTAEQAGLDLREGPVPAWLGSSYDEAHSYSSPSLSDSETSQPAPRLRAPETTEEEQATQLYVAPPPAPATLSAPRPSPIQPSVARFTTEEDPDTEGGGHGGPPPISALGAPSSAGADPLDAPGHVVRPTAFVTPRAATPAPLGLDTAETAVPMSSDIPTVQEERTQDLDLDLADTAEGPALGDLDPDAPPPYTPRPAPPIQLYALGIAGLMVVVGLLSVGVRCLG